MLLLLIHNFLPNNFPRSPRRGQLSDADVVAPTCVVSCVWPIVPGRGVGKRKKVRRMRKVRGRTREMRKMACNA
jgi:hypothetical protein